MKSKSFLILVVIVAAVAVYFWPAPDPLNGVETVALASSTNNGGANLSSDVLEGVEFALGKHKIRIVSDQNQADAVIEITPQSGDFAFSIDNEGFQGTASIRCLVRKNGEESVMYLNLTLDDNGFNAEFEGRKFWEVWK